jgi:hypothetical protein
MGVIFMSSQDVNTLKPEFIVSVRGPGEEQWIRENNRCRAYINRICSWTTEIER